MDDRQQDDRRLLERAARAAGIDVSRGVGHQDGMLFVQRGRDPRLRSEWNPLTDDGDAFRLAVKLNMDVDVSWAHQRQTVVFTYQGTEDDSDVVTVEEPHGSDPYAATRRAIVRAAAAMAPDDPA